MWASHYNKRRQAEICGNNKIKVFFCVHAQLEKGKL
jgi:hypothetical protein